ncbi:AAA family ATPase [Psychrobium sp. MM17-31]|uniref:AAA family ATPase n=1 Tax=Psychrobium sp. MM17-31 TaxID=2917758 RepID=UPI001EF66516|nr:AAA family ATPase [Psychrobium sp. MM17-31]MCG7531086.1 AAA family ATPase [Psychrobium sp. MM17-31]
MKRVLIFGNSGSGKSTLAKKLAAENQLAHLDLDTVAWQATTPVTRMPIEESKALLDDFTAENDNWVIEGCYADLLELLTPVASEMIFMNLPVEACIANAKARPWEPHKYESKAAQDANLDMLIDWIAQYTKRDDTFSQRAHQQLFDSFTGVKRLITCNS